MARIRVERHDGEVGTLLQPNRKGDPEDPPTDDELHRRFEELVSPVIGGAASRAPASAGRFQSGP